MTARAARRLVLGVDGGSSKTVALVAGEDGEVLGAGRAGNADIYVSPGAVDEVASAIAAALAGAGLRGADLGAAALSLVGADWPEDFDHWRAALGRVGLGHLGAGRALVVNDAIGALAAGAPTGPAIVVVCGTGTATGARGPSGREWHSSFWQRTQGGKELARRGFDAVYLAELGLGPPTALTAAALRHVGVGSVEALLHAYTRRGDNWRARATEFTPLVLDAAAAGDDVARGLVLSQAEALAGYAVAAASRVGIDGADGRPVRLVLTGGVFRHPSGLMPEHLAATVRAALPAVALEVARGVPEPVLGALALAIGALGLPPDGARPRLMATAPPPAFYQTAGGTA